MSMIDQSTITCWNCGSVTVEIMPTNAGQFFDPCNGCGEALRPKPGVLRLLIVWLCAMPADPG